MATNNASSTTVVTKAEPNIVIRALWFIFVGWWLSQLVIILGWLCNLTVVLLPAGIALLNRIPQVTTLKLSSKTHVVVQAEDGSVSTTRAMAAAQLPFVVRALWFVFVGWWASLLWFEIAWLLCITIIGLPLAFWMFGASGKVLTLKR